MSPESADAMIDAFPPIGERVATKSDLDTVVRLVEHKIDTEVAELRADFAELKAEVKTDIAEFKAEVKTDIAGLKVEVKTDIAGLRVEVAKLRAENKDDLQKLQSTMITTVLAANGATATIIGLAIVLAKIV